MMVQQDGSRGDIILYSSPEGGIELDVRLQQETVWLSQKQMSDLFGKDVRTINEHVRNVFDDGELEKDRTIRKFRIVRKEGQRQVQREIEHYNLDMIISVGYRVKSLQGVRFRQWATRILRNHIVQGYTVNQSRLQELNRAVKLITDTAHHRAIGGDEAKALLAVIGDYGRALGLLDDYDHQRVRVPETKKRAVQPLDYDEALRIVEQLRNRFAESDVFGVEKDKGLDAALGAIMQTFGGKDLYPSIEEKAANLLYLLVKNHAFVDGNKRIAATLFLWFLERNDLLIQDTGEDLVSNETLVAMTLMIAESHPEERETLVRIIVHLLCH